jgi:hypothetical protein
MEFVTTFPLSGNGTDFREFGYTGSSDDISGCWIAVTICMSGARHNIISGRHVVLHKQKNNEDWIVIEILISRQNLTAGHICKRR